MMRKSEEILRHLAIIHTWSSFADERGELMNPLQIRDTAKWSKEIYDLVKEQVDYEEYLKKHRVKGQLAGSIVMPIRDVLEHQSNENYQKQIMQLKKLANNPALSDDVKDLLDNQALNINLLIFWKKRYEELKTGKKHEVK